MAVESRALAGDVGGELRDLLVALDVVGVRGVLEPRLGDRLQPANPVDPGLHSRYRRGFVPQVLDIEQAVLLLELEPPFDKRAVQLARRKLAKRWHPDIAPPGRQLEHERHLKAINEAADQLERLAEDSRGGKVSRNAVKVVRRGRAQAARRGGRRAYEAEQRAARAAEDREKHDPFASRVPDHSVVHRYARCLSYPEWGVGSVTGIYFTGDGDDIQQWARVTFQVGVRTVPAGSLQFVDFSKPDPGADRVERFMTAAKHALAEGDFALAAQRLVYARDADPRNAAVLRLLTIAFWQAATSPAAGRAVRDWARAEAERPAPHRYAARIYEDMGALSLAVEAAVRETELRARRRLGLGAARPPAPAHLRPRGRARRARARALDRAERAGPARPRARREPDRRRRRRGLGLRAGDGARARLRRRVVALRPRARAHRPHERVPRGLRAGARAARRPRGPRPARAGRGLGAASDRSRRLELMTSLLRLAAVEKSGCAPCAASARPFGSSQSSWRPSAVRSRK